LWLEHTRKSAALVFTVERNEAAARSAELIRRNQELCDKTQRRIASLNGVRRSTEILLKSLDLISFRLPKEGISLTELRLQQREVILKGHSSSFSAVTDLVVSLDQAPFLYDVTLEGWSQQATGFIFEILFSLDD
jgi:Tfp pilus assembly protein PilN